MATLMFTCYICDKPAPTSESAGSLACPRCWKLHRLVSRALNHRAPTLHPEDEVLPVDDGLEKTDPKGFDAWWLRPVGP